MNFSCISFSYRLELSLKPKTTCKLLYLPLHFSATHLGENDLLSVYWGGVLSLLCKFQFLTLNIFLTPLSPILGLFSNPSKNFNRKSCRKLNVDQFFFNIITFPLKGFFHELSAKTTEEVFAPSYN